VHVEFGNFDTA